MADQNDPYAALAKKNTPASSDPYASIAKKGDVRPAGLPAGFDLPGIPNQPDRILKDNPDKKPNPFWHNTALKYPVTAEVAKKTRDFALGLPKGLLSTAHMIGLGSPEDIDAANEQTGKTIVDAAEEQKSASGPGIVGDAKSLSAGLDTALGGDTTSGRQNWDQGNYGRAAADYLTGPVLGYMTAKAIEKVPLGSSRITGAPLEAQEAVSVQAPKAMKLSLYDEPGVMKGVTGRLRQVARDQGISDANLKDSLPTGNPEISRPKTWLRKSGDDMGETPVTKGKQLRRQLWDATKDSYDKQYKQLIDPYKNQSTVANKFAADSLRHSIPEADLQANPTLGRKVETIAKRIESGNATIGQMDEMRKSFNDLADSIYRRAEKGISQNDTDTARANEEAANSIRNALYDDMSMMSGVPKEEIASLKREHGAAIGLAREAEVETNRLGPSEAAFRQKGRLKYALQGSGTESSVSASKTVKRLLSKSPQAEQNAFMRDTLSHIGKGGEVPSFTPEPRRVPGLPPPPVQVPTELQQHLQSTAPSTQNAEPSSFAVDPVKQLPAISGVETTTEGTTEVTGGVFPNRPFEGASTNPHWFNPENPVAGVYQRNPMFVTDYVGSGRGGELPAMPGSKRGLFSVSTPQQAASALRGYDTFMNSDEFKTMDPAKQAEVKATRNSLESFSKQGENGAVGTRRVSQFKEPANAESSPSRGANAGTIEVKTPVHAREMLDGLVQNGVAIRNVDGSFSIPSSEVLRKAGIDGATETQLRETVENLKKMAGMKEVGDADVLPRMKSNPGKTVTTRKLSIPHKIAKYVLPIVAGREASKYRALPPPPPPDALPDNMGEVNTSQPAIPATLPPPPVGALYYNNNPADDQDQNEDENYDNDNR